LRIGAGVAELADAQDLKSWVPQGACGFDSRPRHFANFFCLTALANGSCSDNESGAAIGCEALASAFAGAKPFGVTVLPAVPAVGSVPASVPVGVPVASANACSFRDASEHAGRQMASDFHRDGVGDAGAREIADGGPPEIVEDTSRTAGLRTGGAPRPGRRGAREERTD
jgi:hypothetical protein